MRSSVIWWPALQTSSYLSSSIFARVASVSLVAILHNNLALFIFIGLDCSGKSNVFIVSDCSGKSDVRQRIRKFSPISRFESVVWWMMFRAIWFFGGGVEGQGGGARSKTPSHFTTSFLSGFWNFWSIPFGQYLSLARWYHRAYGLCLDQPLSVSIHCFRQEWMDEFNMSRVLSIQSHVVSGCKLFLLYYQGVMSDAFWWNNTFFFSIVQCSLLQDVIGTCSGYFLLY